MFFFGLAGSGKTTAARYLANKYNLLRFSEGAALREVCKTLYIPQTRANLQLVGEGMRSILGVNCWLDVILRKIEIFGLDGKNICIDDIRHPEDAEVLKAHGWVAVQLLCDKDIRYQRLKERDGDDVDLLSTEIVSEHLMDEWDADYVIDNSGSKEKLDIMLDGVIQQEKELDITSV
jgi:dephospho-CoA kinase